MKVAHWEIYVSRERSTGGTPWAIVESNAKKITAEYASDIIITVRAYTGKGTSKDRPQFVIQCFGQMRRSGTVVYIEEVNA